MATKFSIKDFNKRYKNDDVCLHEIFTLRYPDGVDCKVCKRVTKYYKITNRKAYSCEFCRTQLYPLAGTVFEKSTTSLRTWFFAIFLMTSTRSGISAKTVERLTGVTYKTAWRMYRQIRILMTDVDITPLDGVVEIDETFVGGKGANRKNVPHFNEKPKEIVMGMVKRKGKAYLRHIPNTGKYTLIDQIDRHVDPKARIMTDQYAGYIQLKKRGYSHSVVNHTYEYAKGNVHTQNVENVWSHLKRGIFGVYRHVSKKYLQMYADEFAFRYNNRKDPSGMFDALLDQVSMVRVVK